MQVKNLTLLNYRNYEYVNIDFSENRNVIYGDNAQGKTNILEAIFLCATGRSHRTSKDNELVKFEEKGYSIITSVVKGNEEDIIEIKYRLNQKKEIRINEIPVKRIGSLIGTLNVVMFSPEDLLMIKEGPSERRRFLDITISQLKPAYFFDLQQYAKILTQRNSLLKNIQNNKALADTLEVWSENLAHVGARIIYTRREFIKRLNIFANENHKRLSDQKENLELEYNTTFDIKGKDEIKEIAVAFIEVLNRARNSEIQKGTTIYGPQRDDCEILLNGNKVKLFGSQGQQRTAVLSMKLAEIDIMKENTGEYPVLLLDDVMSELDEKRREYLFNSINYIQTFITCTEKNFYSGKIKDKHKMFKVYKGTIEA